MIKIRIYIKNHIKILLSCLIIHLLYEDILSIAYEIFLNLIVYKFLSIIDNNDD
jgi:hypothetical protein